LRGELTYQFKIVLGIFMGYLAKTMLSWCAYAEQFPQTLLSWSAYEE